MHEDNSLDKPLIDKSSDGPGIKSEGPIIHSQLNADTEPKDKEKHSDSLTEVGSSE